MVAPSLSFSVSPNLPLPHLGFPPVQKIPPSGRESLRQGLGAGLASTSTSEMRDLSRRFRVLGPHRQVAEFFRAFRKEARRN